MKIQAADRPRDRLVSRLLAIDPRLGSIADLRITDLPELLRAGDVLVVNDAATLPASIRAATAAGAPVEVRLAAHAGGSRFSAVLFGAGDWRTPTEHRPPPPPLRAGDELALGGLRARVASVSPRCDRLVELELAASGAELWSAIYGRGRPVQYSYLAEDLALEDVQVSYAARPWSVEMPSAGRPLAWSILFAAMDRGVAVRTVTHAAGLSATGDDVLDAMLPLEERYEIPQATARAIARARAEGGRVIAAGTSVVRALESAAEGDGVRAGAGETTLRIDGDHVLRVAEGILSGVHEPGATHFALLEAFAPRALLERANVHAAERGYLGHELGDSCLILRS